MNEMVYISGSFGTVHLAEWRGSVSAPVLVILVYFENTP